MKAKKITALAVAIVLALSLSGFALAGSSPSGSTGGSTSPVVVVDSIGPLSSGTERALTQAAQDHIAANYPGYAVETLLSVDIKVTRLSGSGSITLSLNVAGARVGDRILVIHQKPGGDIEIVPAVVLDDGVIQFSLSSFSPISIVRVSSADAVAARRLPKTGDQATAAPMVLLLMAGFLTLVICSKALKETR